MHLIMSHVCHPIYFLTPIEMHSLNNRMYMEYAYKSWPYRYNYLCFFVFRYHFGLVKVDFDDPQRSRTPKESYTFFKNVVSKKSLNYMKSQSELR